MRAGDRPWLFLLAAGVAGFLAAAGAFRSVKHTNVSGEIEVSLPLFVQVAMAGGDRFLAANIASIRALVTDTVRMKAAEYRVLAQVQRDASWLNAAHEDNYYTAAAILAWNGELETAQTVLARAMTARPFDYQPAFYYAFNLAHFNGNALGASESLRAAAAKLHDDEVRLLMENYAARLADRAADLDLAIRVVEAMAKQAKRRDFQKYLLLRVERLRKLVELRRAAADYRRLTGNPPGRLDDLVGAGLLKALPDDPFGFGFALNPQGLPILVNTLAK